MEGFKGSRFSDAGAAPLKGVRISLHSHVSYSIYMYVSS